MRTETDTLRIEIMNFVNFIILCATFAQILADEYDYDYDRGDADDTAQSAYQYDNYHPFPQSDCITTVSKCEQRN